MTNLINHNIGKEHWKLKTKKPLPPNLDAPEG
jgi:hypothetical protein